MCKIAKLIFSLTAATAVILGSGCKTAAKGGCVAKQGQQSGACEKDEEQGHPQGDH
jgi:hypothetical protein